MDNSPAMRRALAEYEAQLPPGYEHEDCLECGQDWNVSNPECAALHRPDLADARACHEEDERDGRGTEGRRK